MRRGSIHIWSKPLSFDQATTLPLITANCRGSLTEQMDHGMDFLTKHTLSLALIDHIHPSSTLPQLH